MDEDGEVRGLSMQGLAEPGMALDFMPNTTGSHWRVLSRVTWSGLSFKNIYLAAMWRSEEGDQDGGNCMGPRSRRGEKLELELGSL